MLLIHRYAGLFQILHVPQRDAVFDHWHFSDIYVVSLVSHFTVSNRCSIYMFGLIRHLVDGRELEVGARSHLRQAEMLFPVVSNN